MPYFEMPSNGICRRRHWRRRWRSTKVVLHGRRGSIEQFVQSEGDCASKRSESHAEQMKEEVVDDTPVGDADSRDPPW